MSRLVLAVLLLAATFCAPAHGETLYKRLGGTPGISRIVDDALAIYVSDSRIKADFDNINLAWLRLRFIDFLCQLTGGPCHYRGRSMAAAHKGLHLGQAEFNAVAEGLETAMDRAGIPYWTQNRLMALLAPMAHDIVTR